MTRAALLLATLFTATAAHAAEPVKIGITTVLSGPNYDRGQSEQYGAQLAINKVNESGGVLGRPVEAFYADNAAKPDIGVPATKRLIEQEHVPVIIGALATPVTKAIEPVVQEAKIPLIIATSAGQDFVDRSGAGGNPYLFKTIPSELDIARGLMKYLAAQKVKSVAIAAGEDGFSQANARGMAKAAAESGIKLTDDETVAKGTTDFSPIIAKMRDSAPEQIVLVLGPATVPFVKATVAAGWKVPVTGRFDVPAVAAAGGTDVTSVASFVPFQDKPAVKAFVAAYQSHYGLMPTQRSFYVYEATLLAVDAIRRAKSDKPAAIEAALKTTTMPSAIGGTYKMDDHNHPHTPLLIVGMKDGKPSVVASE